MTDTPRSYAGLHAELYDALYADKPYAQEAGAVHAVLGKHWGKHWGKHSSQRQDGTRRRILDLACGTGRHALELIRLGHDVTGLDHSPDMLAVAKARAEAANVPLPLLQADMTEIPKAGAPFDAVCSFFDAIGYLQTNARILQAMAAVRERLIDNGLFILEFWHAPAMLRGFDPLRLRRLRLADREVLRISETTLDIPNQLAHVRYSFISLQDDGRWSQCEETQTNRFFQVQEMHALLQAAGFSPLEFLAGYTGGVIDQDTWHVVAVAQKAG